MGCEGCLTSGRNQQAALEDIRKQAKKYAVENKKMVAIYKEGNEFVYTNMEEAIRNHYPITEVLSFHQRTSAV